MLKALVVSGTLLPLMKKYRAEFLYVELVIVVDIVVGPRGPMTYSFRTENFLDINNWI